MNTISKQAKATTSKSSFLLPGESHDDRKARFNRYADDWNRICETNGFPKKGTKTRRMYDCKSSCKGYAWRSIRNRSTAPFG